MSVYLYTLRKSKSVKFTLPNGETARAYRYEYKTCHFDWEQHQKLMDAAQNRFKDFTGPFYVIDETNIYLQNGPEANWVDTESISGMPVAVLDNGKLIPVNQEHIAEKYEMSERATNPTNYNKLEYLKECMPAVVDMWLQFNGCLEESPEVIDTDETDMLWDKINEQNEIIKALEEKLADAKKAVNIINEIRNDYQKENERLQGILNQFKGLLSA
tara:strand:+ start:192 stop:836 length:645 start_codon:yes stop_codon:yes gene_type:complete